MTRTRREKKQPSGSQGTLLAIDVGNTHTVLGVFQRGQLVEFWRMGSQVGRTGDELAVIVGALCRNYGEALREAGRVVLSSVVPALTPEFEVMTRRLYGIEPLVVRAGLQLGVKLDVLDPTSLGPDRIANAVAVADGALPAIVVDMGTATTFDVIRRGKRYVGGAIAPGLQTSVEGLFRTAAKLPKVEIRKPRRTIGRTTEESIQSGVFYGIVGAIDGTVRRMMDELRRKPRVVATGGLARLVAAASETIDEVDEALTLRGLAMIDALNR